MSAMTTLAAPPAAGLLEDLVDRFDPSVVDPADPQRRVRLEVTDGETADVLFDADGAELVPVHGEADALISGSTAGWEALEIKPWGGLYAWQKGALQMRRNLQVTTGFMAATSGDTRADRLELRSMDSPVGRLSYVQAGPLDAPPVIAIHGLGATKWSMITTVHDLRRDFRMIALDLPGFGDSTKPLAAPYDAEYLAKSVIHLLDELGIERAHLVGNSLGGRTSLELALRHPDRVGRVGLLCPSMAWRRKRMWAPLLRLVRPELGLLQPIPRSAVEAFVERNIPGASNAWVAAGIDEFLRAFVQARGRAAFYAATRQVYLEEPEGDDGFWPRLRSLEPETLFVWGKHDPLVPIGFARHVTDAIPAARHLELSCGHVPQIERPRQAHGALRRFFSEE